MFQNILESQSAEIGQGQLQTLKEELKIAIERAKILAVSCKVGKYQETQFRVDRQGQLITPEYIPSINYNQQFWKKYLKNQINFAIIKELSQKINQLQEQLKNIDGLSEEYQKLYRIKNRKKNRRLASQIEKKYQCPYEECYRVYGSDVSLNLHIKLKHNGGNKTDREQLAEAICLADLRGEPRPPMKFNLPNGYLEQYRRSYLEKHESQEEDSWLQLKKRQLLKYAPLERIS